MSLTRHLERKDSPVRLFFVERFGDAVAARRSLRVSDDPGVVCSNSTAPLNRADRAQAWSLGHPSVVPMQRDNHPWPAVGTAFDYRARYFFESGRVEDLVARRGAGELAAYWDLSSDTLPAFEELRDVVESLVAHTPLAAVDEGALAQACYALALYEQCRRAIPGESWPLVQLGPKATLAQVYGVIDPAAVDNLVALTRTFETTQHVLIDTRPIVLNPTFEEGSMLVDGADADLIAGTRLLDIKTTMGTTIERVALWQIAGYALCDLHDEFGIREVALYYSRHGVQAVWTLEGLLALLSGGPVDLAEVRSSFRSVLEGLDTE